MIEHGSHLGGIKDFCAHGRYLERSLGQRLSGNSYFYSGRGNDLAKFNSKVYQLGFILRVLH